MKRRTFIKSSLGAGAALLSVAGRQEDSKNRKADDLLVAMVKANDVRIVDILDSQTREKDHPFTGGFPDRYGIYHAGTASSYINSLTAGYISPQSEFHQSAAIEESLALAIEFLIARQHEDGTIDLVTTNFHSTPDTGFVVEPLAIALCCLRRHAADQLARFQARAGEFLVKAGEALSRGGIHTPNHRWVVCMALARIHQLFPDQKYTRRINVWLAEKIDIDPDGQYTEKSTAVYTPLVNRCLISMARLLNRPELLDPVRKNLDMTQYFVRANGEIVTDASRRQDQYQTTGLERYYYAYRYMALRDRAPMYAAMTRFIEDKRGYQSLAGNLSYFLEDATLLQELPEGGNLIDSYEKPFPHSGLVRIRRNEIDATILRDNDRILTFQKGSNALQALRMATAFFGKGQFVAESLTHENDKYILRQTLEGPYYQPLSAEHLPDDGDWARMPRDLRPTSEVQTLTSTITVSELNGRLTVSFDVGGTDHVPLAIELAFRSGGQLSGVKPVPDLPNSWLLESGLGKYQVGEDTIEFGPGQALHSWTQLRGANVKLDAESVYLTGYTPFKFELSLA